MKKIIAAALSVLVGAFGYTIVDSAIENRVATLESEVVELREEVSKNHPQNLTITDPYEGSSAYTTETEQNITTTVENFTEFQVGSFLKEKPDTMHKFYLRRWSNGKVYYVSPGEYGNQSVSNEAEMSRLLNLGYISKTYRAGITEPLDGRIETTIVNNRITDPDDHRHNPTTTALTYEEHFLYVTESTAQLADTFEDVSYSYFYNNDYSMASTAFTKVRYPINVKCKGYTDSSFAGKQIVFSVSWIGNSRPDVIMSNIIKADGSFEYEAIYYASYRMYNYDASYSLSSISVN